ARRAVGLAREVEAAALVEPGLVLVALREAERDGAGEGEGGDLAGLVAVESLHHLEGAAAHGVEGLRRRHDLAGREEIDLELAAGELADACDELLLELLRRGAAIPERLHPPGDGLLRPHDRGCGKARAG